MTPACSRSSDRAAHQPALIISHSQQEAICKEVHDYIARIKIQKLREAVLQFNKIIKQILK